jgi:two-component system, NarL family, sensor histidine kinase UhpB
MKLPRFERPPFEATAPHTSSELSGFGCDAPGIVTVLRAVFDPSPSAVCITADDHIVFTNPAFAAFFDVPQGDTLVGRLVYSLLPPPLHQAVRLQGQQALAGREPNELLHQQFVRRDGATRELTWVASALPELGTGVLQRVLNDVTEQTQERVAWERSRRELQRLSANQVDAREAERRHIAREMHDELGQRLTALKMELASLARQRYHDSDARISAMLNMVDDTVASVRRIASDLRPMMLDDLGLNPAIEWLARESARRMNIQVSVNLEARALPNENQLVIGIYRIVQEALTNVARHANATSVHIETKREGDELRVVVRDNGSGFSAQAMQRDDSHGLIGMRERTLSLGGHFEIGNLPSGGARIAIRLPLQLTDGRPKILTERRGRATAARLELCELPATRKHSAVQFAFDRAVKSLQSIAVKA